MKLRNNSKTWKMRNNSIQNMCNNNNNNNSNNNNDKQKQK